MNWLESTENRNYSLAYIETLCTLVIGVIGMITVAYKN